MAIDDIFEPRLGRVRSGGRARVRPYLHRILAAANRARVGPATETGRAGFAGSRIGRGAGAGRLLSTRNTQALRGARRVVVKTRIVRLAGKGAGAALAHLRYLQRDGVTREGRAGELYGPGEDRIDGKDFLERGAGDRHQFRFIVSAEDGDRYVDLKPLTRRLMAAMERDLDTRLDWVAVDHHNTGHPHTHIILRGKDDQARDLIIARDYIAHGLRERAIELVGIDLGPRSEQDIADQLRTEVEQERLTTIDRRLLRERDEEGCVRSGGTDAFDQSIRQGRLRKLERLGLAELMGDGRWQLAGGFDETLTRISERQDIIRTMQRAIGDRGIERAPVDQHIYDPGNAPAAPLIGHVLQRGLSDELADRHFLLVDGVDGRTHYVDIGKGEALDPLARDAIVRIEPATGGIRDVDQTIVRVAAAYDGRYDIGRHLRQDPTATERFAETHVRRLEAIRRATGALEREPSGSWIIAPDHLERVAAYEAARAREQPVRVTILAHEPLDRLVAAEAATWIDRDLAGGHPTVVRDAGFGRDVSEARQARQRWLVEQDLADDRQGQVLLRSDALKLLQRRELLRVSGSLSEELGTRFTEAAPGQSVSGTLTRSVQLMSGRYALIERTHDFSLVPWRETLTRQIGKSVSGVMRDGDVNWEVGRKRSVPTMG